MPRPRPTRRWIFYLTPPGARVVLLCEKEPAGPPVIELVEVRSWASFDRLSRTDPAYYAWSAVPAVRLSGRYAVDVLESLGV